MDPELVSTLSGIVRNAAPILIACQGELLTERAGVVNLSLNGTIMLAAMAAFVVTLTSSSLAFGLVVAMLIGVVVAVIILTTSIFLKLDQIAIGFILTLLCADLAVFLGRNYTGESGQEIQVPYMPISEFIPKSFVVSTADIPIIGDLLFRATAWLHVNLYGIETMPAFGEIFFQHNVLIYFSLVLVIMVWFWMYHTRFGLELRGLGERPQAAYVRGVRVQAWRYFYVAVGGALVGLAGATFSLSVKLGWKETGGIDGQGWIALAIVIFGAWRPFRVAFGVYLIVGLRALAQELQDARTPKFLIDTLNTVGLRDLAQQLQGNQVFELPVQILNMIPWILMLFTLMFVSGGLAERILVILPRKWRPAAQRFLRSNPPAALGTNFEKD